MTTAEINQYFSYHNSNMKLLKIGFDEIRNQLKNIYKSKSVNDEYIYALSDIHPVKVSTRKVEKSLSRIISGIQVSWAEESIKRLLYEENLLTEVQRNYLLDRPALDQRWLKALHIVFCIAYDLVPTADEKCETVQIEDERANLGDELVDQYLELKSIITTFLSPNFSIRNKVQHGEWEFAFESDSKLFSANKTAKVNHENIITTTSRYTLVNAFYNLIVDLARFKSNSFALDSMLTPFEFFYPSYMKKIRFETTKISNPMLEDFILQTVEKEIRGNQYRSTI